MKATAKILNDLKNIELTPELVRETVEKFKYEIALDVFTEYASNPISEQFDRWLSHIVSVRIEAEQKKNFTVSKFIKDTLRKPENIAVMKRLSQR